MPKVKVIRSGERSDGTPWRQLSKDGDLFKLTCFVEPINPEEWEIDTEKEITSTVDKQLSWEA